MMTQQKSRCDAWLSVVAGCAIVAALTGCAATSIGTSVSSPPVAGARTAPTGRVMGGQQPISGATVQLYAVNLTTAKGVSTGLFGVPLVTDTNGNFTVPSFTCPTGALVYIVATQGDSGAGNNPATSLMAALGLCSNLNQYSFLDINEVTTVASVYALAPFMADYQHVGTTASNVKGITNAFATVGSLVNINTGVSPGASAPPNAAIPTATIYTLADIIASCINSTGGTQCSTLFGLALPQGSIVQPSDTIGALLNIAQNPGNNVAGLYIMAVPASPFQPTLTVQPPDFTLAIKLTGSGLSSPYGVAIDASGNAWVTNESGTSVTEFNPLGGALSGTNGYGSPYLLGPQGLTIDNAGRVWIANTGGNSVVVLNSSGGFVSPTSGYTTPSISGPVDVAADARGNVWVTNFLGNSVTELSSSGALVGSGGLTAGGTLLRPDAVAIDPAGGVWISNSGAGTLTRYDKNATLINAGYTDNALQAPAGIALDASNNAWAAGAGGPELTGITSAGSAVAASPVYAALTRPTGVAIDGSGAIWVANSGATGYLSEFAAGTGLPIAASQALGSLSSPVEIAIDAAGNLWSANSGDDSVTVFIGLAAPKLTPLVSHTN